MTAIIHFPVLIAMRLQTDIDLILSLVAGFYRLLMQSLLNEI